MCLILEKNHLKRMIAKEDIPITKVVNYRDEEFGDKPIGYYSPYQNSLIRFDIVLESDLEKPHQEGIFCSSYDKSFYHKKYGEQSLFEKVKEHLKRVNLYSVSIGFHSFDNNFDNKMKEHLKLFCNTIINGIIPKGSEYYYNPELGAYVSNQIKYFKP